MTKFGFVDCVSNVFDSFELAASLVDTEFQGNSIQRLTAPEILKVPVCVKKLLAGDADAVIVFATALKEDFDSLHLIVEKTIDLELEFQKYVFYCIVSEEEFTSKEEFEEMAKTRIAAFLDLALKSLSAPSEVSSQVGSGVDFSMFASFAENNQLPSSASQTQETSEGNESGKSLF